MVNIVEEKYKIIFLQTASNYLKKLQQSVVVLIHDPENTSVIEDAYLAAHSLKSENLMMQYKNLATFFLLLENMFKARRDKTFTFTKEALIIINDEIEKILSAVPKMVNENQPYDVTATYQKLKELSGMTVEEL